LVKRNDQISMCEALGRRAGWLHHKTLQCLLMLLPPDVLPKGTARLPSCLFAGESPSGRDAGKGETTATRSKVSQLCDFYPAVPDLKCPAWIRARTGNMWESIWSPAHGEGDSSYHRGCGSGHLPQTQGSCAEAQLANRSLKEWGRSAGSAPMAPGDRGFPWAKGFCLCPQDAMETELTGDPSEVLRKLGRTLDQRTK